MIIIDTNVLSEIMRPTMDARVKLWLNHFENELWMTTLTTFEIRLGLMLLPIGKRRRNLETEYKSLVDNYFIDKTLSFDEESAFFAAQLQAQRKKRGVNTEMRDTMIAGIALAHRATLATRNIKDFKDTGVKLVSPWE